MPTRVIGQNPGLPTLIQLLAGYGAGARETAAANAATRTRSNEMLGRGIGEGIGNLFQVPAQLAQQERTMGMEFKQKLALQKAALDNAMQVEQVRSQGNVYEQAAQDFQKRWGVPYTAVIEQARAAGFQVPGMSAFGQSSPQAAPGEFGVSMPGQEMSQTFPSPPAQAPSPGVALPLANPAMTQEYQQAKKELSKWEAAAATERLKPMPSRSHPLYGQAADERAQTLNTLTQRIAGAREVLGKYQEPKPPATEQELISSGALIPLQGGRLFYQDPDGKKHVTAPTKMQEADIEYETHMLDGTVRKSKAGSMVEIKPGIYQITDKSGNVSGWNEPSVKEGKGDKPIFDATDILKVQKDLATKDKDNNPILASPEEATRHLVKAQIQAQQAELKVKAEPYVRRGNAMLGKPIDVKAFSDLVAVVEKTFGASRDGIPQELDTILGRLGEQVRTGIVRRPDLWTQPGWNPQGELEGP